VCRKYVYCPRNRGRLELSVEFGELPKVFTASGFELLPIDAVHAVQYRELPMLHGAPFDRMLVAQSICEPLRLLTSDRILSQYGNTVLEV
jgi:PIN domain nuclease of toxin-antitoxin system